MGNTTRITKIRNDHIQPVKESDNISVLSQNNAETGHAKDFTNTLHTPEEDR